MKKKRSVTAKAAKAAAQSTGARRNLLRTKRTPPSKKPAAQEPASPKATAKPALGAAAGTPGPTNGRTSTPAGLKIPSILLEGDEPSHAAPVAAVRAAPQQPASVAAVAVKQAERELTDLPELPQAYGTGRLLLVAREPHWLYAQWDLPFEKQRECNQLSPDRHLRVRVYASAVPSQVVREVHVHPESQHWFVHVEKAGVKYFAQLGYHQPGGGWVAITTSPEAVTPLEAPVPGTFSEPAVFASAPAFDRPSPLPLLSMEAGGTKPEESARPSEWTQSQAAALTAMAPGAHATLEGASSAEAAELARRARKGPIAPPKEARPGLPIPLEMAGPSSPALARGEAAPSAAGAPRQFWLSVNAELIIYGATEPTARLKIGERELRLRPDGTFSCRFALPDGLYQLTLTATSADGLDGRRVGLWFSRDTDYQGPVEAHPQDAALKPPHPENA